MTRPRTALLSSLALLAAAPATAGAADSRIAYELLTGGIYTVGTDGTKNRLVVPKANQMTWSPAGDRLLYAARYGIDGLWTAKPDGSARKQLLKAAGHPIDGQDDYLATAPAWSPDGKRVAFAALWEVRVPGADDGEVESVSQIATIARSGTGLRSLRRGADPSWSPEGGRIAYVATEGNTQSRIADMRADGSGVRTLVPSDNRFRTALEHSPDGRRLVFLQDTQIRLLDLRTKKVRAIPAKTTGRVLDVTWTPDGRRLAYIHNSRRSTGPRTPPTSVYTIRPDGTGKQRRFTLPEDERRGTWAETLTWR